MLTYSALQFMSSIFSFVSSEFLFVLSAVLFISTELVCNHKAKARRKLGLEQEDEPEEPSNVKVIKPFDSGPYIFSPVLQSVSVIIETINAGEETYFPKCGDVAVGTVPITELDSDSKICSICRELLEDYKPKTEWWKEHCVVVTSCGHAFGGSCILEWMKTQGRESRSCPMCRQRFHDQDQSPIQSESRWAVHRQNISMLDDTFRFYYPPGSFRGLLARPPAWFLHQVLAINIFLRCADEIESSVLLLHIARAKRIVEILWDVGKDRGFDRPEDLDFVMDNPPEAENYGLYLNVLHDLVAEYEAKIRPLVQDDIVMLKLANFNGAEIEAGKIQVERETNQMAYYLDYAQHLRDFKEIFFYIQDTYGFKELDDLWAGDEPVPDFDSDSDSGYGSGSDDAEPFVENEGGEVGAASHGLRVPMS